MSSLHPLLPQCLYQFLAFVPPSNESLRKPGMASVMVDTQHPLTLLLNSSVGDRELCKIQYHFGEFGNYSLVVKTLSTSTQNVSCDLIINEGPINSYLPILFAFLVYTGILAILIVGVLMSQSPTCSPACRSCPVNRLPCASCGTCGKKCRVK
uniref:Uncharacterized protein n=1 Tax=Malurus cyaneus samueli TaxID=2593467 RepID=A0A8C5U0K8_9PASS